jgi:hypothetical protein
LTTITSGGSSSAAQTAVGSKRKLAELAGGKAAPPVKRAKGTGAGGGAAAAAAAAAVAAAVAGSDSDDASVSSQSHASDRARRSSNIARPSAGSGAGKRHASATGRRATPPDYRDDDELLGGASGGAAGGSSRDMDGDDVDGAEDDDDADAVSIMVEARKALPVMLPEPVPALLEAPAPNPAAYRDPVGRTLALASHSLTQSAAAMAWGAPVDDVVSAALASLLASVNKAVIKFYKKVARRSSEVSEAVMDAGNAAGSSTGSSNVAGAGAAVHYCFLPKYKDMRSWQDLETLFTGGFRPVITVRPGVTRPSGPHYPPLDEWTNADHRWATHGDGQQVMRTKFTKLRAMYGAAMAACAERAAADEPSRELSGEAHHAATQEMLTWYHPCLHKPTESCYKFYLKWYLPKVASGSANPFLDFNAGLESRDVKVTGNR